MTTARFLLLSGRTSGGLGCLHEMVERWPADPSGYVALADAYSGLGRESRNVPRDLDRARFYIEEGISAVGDDPRALGMLRDRLEDVERRQDAAHEHVTRPES